ncbi:conserved hypothetical protein [Candida tropicalis MYA-3404]|uniref:Uncharacterized protein n=1 Tax=Candida tropicalis (strain ATCC MYA-3404 / T1) TaxID=294747 RepID=C5M323_CANTT|nr:conserved hypothetical protein [Candida tropicalis MYA-3404]EER35724.1 conserved hypothetical protein [Candida tropicalis MYA-3404]KAG4409835.1 hypothetical protein JTP64_000473 [Candida tropicalis]
MSPFFVSTVGSIHWWLNGVWITIGPVVMGKIIELFGPKQTCKTLTKNTSKIFRKWEWTDFPVKFISLGLTLGEYLIQFIFINFALVSGELITNGDIITSWNIIKSEPSSSFGTGFIRVNGTFFFINNIIMETILDIFVLVFLVVQSLSVGFIFSENQLWFNIWIIFGYTRGRCKCQVTFTKFLSINFNSVIIDFCNTWFVNVNIFITSPCPDVSQGTVG